MVEPVVVVAKGFTPTPGGIERYSAEVAAGYAELGHRVYVIAPVENSARVHRRGEYVVLPISTKLGQVGVAARMFALGARLRRRFREPRLVHATTWRVSLPMLALFPWRRLAISVHGREIFVVPRLLKPLMLACLKRARAVVYVSNAIEAAARNLVALRHQNAAIAWNGISFKSEAESFKRTYQDVPNVLSFNRLVERKNMLRSIEAYALALQRGARLGTYYIAGDGPDRLLLAQKVEALGLQNKVALLGRIDEGQVTVAYRDCDIFLHPQIGLDGDIEGFGLTIADAMSFGCLAIAGDSGGPRDFVKHDETGLLVNGLDVNAIAEALMSASARSTRARLGDAARQWVLDHLSWSKVAETVLKATR